MTCDPPLRGQNSNHSSGCFLSFSHSTRSKGEIFFILISFLFTNLFTMWVSHLCTLQVHCLWHRARKHFELTASRHSALYQNQNHSEEIKIASRPQETKRNEFIYIVARTSLRPFLSSSWSNEFTQFQFPNSNWIGKQNSTRLLLPCLEYGLNDI